MRHCLVFAFVTASAAAQFVGPGISWHGTLGDSVLSFVPACTSLPVNAIAGDTVELRVWGDIGAPYVLAAAPSTGPCVPLPGIGNGLVLAQPILIVGGGVLTQLTPCLSCPPGFEPLVFTVPLFLPSGTSFSFQAASFGNGNLSLTTGITATVQ